MASTDYCLKFTVLLESVFGPKQKRKTNVTKKNKINSRTRLGCHFYLFELFAQASLKFFETSRGLNFVLLLLLTGNVSNNLGLADKDLLQIRLPFVGVTFL